MTAATSRVQSTPMAPYIGLMRGMKVSDMYIVVDFLKEAIREAEDAKRKAEDAILAEKMAHSENKLPAAFLKLRGSVSFSPEEIASDDRLDYILGK